MTRHLRIAQVAPPLEPVPPPAYGGTERIVDELVRALHGRGHEVTTFASGDSQVPGRLVPTVDEALWRAGVTSDPAPWFLATIHAVLDRASEFDIIHSHLEWYSPLLARVSPIPVVATFHGRLDLAWAGPALARSNGHYVALSRAQAASQPATPWAAVIHNGLTFGPMPAGTRRGDDLAFVGRITPEKGVTEAIEIAQRSGRRLRLAAKSGKTPAERDYFENAFRPALERAGSAVEWLGELSREERDRLLAESWATLMPGDWPEPFGLVAIESLACGVPVVARPVGALPEIVRDGIDGFFGSDLEEMAAAVDRVGRLDRERIRSDVLDRFAADRMADGYETLFGDIAAGRREGLVSPLGESAAGWTAVRPGLSAASRPGAAGPDEAN